MTDEDTRAKYKALKAQADAAYIAATPQRNSYIEAMKPYEALHDEMSDLIDGGDAVTCEACMDPIFDGDEHSVGTDGWLCIKCTHTYQEMLDGPSQFFDADGDPLTHERAKTICDEHVAAGGKLTWGVKDIDAARTLLESKKVRFDGPTQEIPGMVKLATFFDPDGNPMMFYQDLQKA